jgi:hypothetical protein
MDSLTPLVHVGRKRRGSKGLRQFDTESKSNGVRYEAALDTRRKPVAARIPAECVLQI